MAGIDLLGRQLDGLLAEYRHAARSVAEEEAALEAARKKVACTEEAQRLVQAVAEQVQNQAHSQVASVVTRCLKAVFGAAAYEFKVLFERKRGRTEARLVFARNGEELDPATAAGGGVVDVASFALRLACLMLARPQRRKLLVLDEPWKHLSREYRPRVRELVLALAEEMAVQFVLVSHSRQFRIGKVIELGGDHANQ